MNIFAECHHEIRKLFHHANQEGHLRGDDFAIHVIDFAGLHLGVVLGDIANTRGLEALVAGFHFPHQPVERLQSHLIVGDHRMKQMRNVVVHGQFEHLGIHQEKPQTLRGVLQEQAHENAVDANAFSGARRSGHEQVRRFGKIGPGRIAVHIHAQGQGKVSLDPGEFIGIENLAQLDDSRRIIWQFDTHRGLPRNGRNQSKFLAA